ncbi:MAG: glucose-6-phosphate isomerase family protein [Candidatus Micrarchaeota archaeon]
MILYELPIKVELLGTELLVNGKSIPHTVRHMKEMRSIFLDSSGEANDLDLYYMYRSVYSASGMRFDITLIPPRAINGEYVKTYGHYHPIAEKNLTYPEIYQVLNGSASFVLQRKDMTGSVDVIIINAKKGDVLLIPSNYGHATVNTGNEKLILSNVVCDKFDSVYVDFKTMKGAAYYITKEGLVQNTSYLVKSFNKATPEKFNKLYNFSCSDVLVEFYNNPDTFRFLENPSLLFK